MAMVSEWLDNGSLAAYVENNPKADRGSLCMDVCAGLSYIHSNGMVHGDLKAANVMVSFDGTAMIADFGSSHLKDLTLQFSTTKNASISVRWAAPELLTNDNNPFQSKEADVYAYGMTVLETITGQVPYSQYSERRVVVLVGVKNQTPDRPTAAIGDELWKILLECWTVEPSERIDIRSVEEKLRIIFDSHLTNTTATKGSILAEIEKTSPGIPTTGSQGPTMLDNEAQNAVNLRPHNEIVVGLQKMKVGPQATHKRWNEEERPDVFQGIATPVMNQHKRPRIEGRGPLPENAASTRQVVLGGDHPDTLTSMANLAVTYHKQGRLAEAEALQVEVLAARKRVLGDDHPDTLASMANLAVTYYEQGRLAEAEALEVEVLAARKRVLGDDHPDTLTSMGNLAVTYHKLGRLAEAEALEVEALAARKRVLGDDHPHTLTSMGNLASTYRNKGRLAEAEALHVDVLAARKRVLGDDHPHTLKSMANLASTYHEQGRLAEAEALEVAVLAARKRVLGDDHPDTLTSMANLAVTYSEQDRLAEAEALEVEVLAARKRVLGETHPDTLISVRNLALTYQAQGRHSQYDALMTEANAMNPQRNLGSYQ